MVVSLRRRRRRGSSCGHEVEQAHTDGGDEKGHADAAQAEQQFRPARHVARDGAVAEAAAHFEAREDVEREGLPADDEDDTATRRRRARTSSEAARSLRSPARRGWNTSSNGSTEPSSDIAGPEQQRRRCRRRRVRAG